MSVDMNASKGSVFGRFVALAIATALVVVQTSAAFAAQLPIPGSNLFVQTSGPNAGLTIGDYYTSPSGAGTDHLFLVRVPSNWPAGESVTVAIYDPELAGPDPASPRAADEIRGAADTATFRLIDPNGSTVATRTYSGASTNGLWAHLVTFDPGTNGVGNYELRVTVSNDDDNSWRIDVSHDPDCVLGGPDTCAAVVNGNETDSAPAGSGPIGIGVMRTSYQHASGGQSCQDHVFFVSSSLPRPLRAHNFDMDGGGSVTYTDPNGGTHNGTVSADSRWNNSTNATRVGDILADVNGWWTARICISNSNQYVFEAPGVSPTFAEPQPTPRISVTKDDGTDLVSVGELVTYQVTIANVSDTDPLPGDAHDLVATDVLPAGLEYVECVVPAGVSCVQSAGTVTINSAQPIRPGEAITVDIVTSVSADSPSTIDNSVQVTYQDRLGNTMDLVSSNDVDAVDFAPVLSVAVDAPASLLRGRPAPVEFSVAHTASSDGSPVGDVILNCLVCTSLAYVSGDTDSDSLLDVDEIWVYEGLVETGPATSDPLVVGGDSAGLDRDGDAVAASGSSSIDIVEPGTISGTVFEDLDGNGERDPGEPGIDTAVVNLNGPDSPLTSAPGSGSFVFIDLPPGAYEAEVDESALAAGLMATVSPGTVTLTEGASVTSVDFGYAHPVVVTGSVFADLDFDGSRSAEEPGFSGVTVALIDSDGVEVTTVATDDSGAYRFDGLPGRYSVRVVGSIPHGWRFIGPDSRNVGLVRSGEAVEAAPIGLGNEAPQLRETAQGVALGQTPHQLPWADREGGRASFTLLMGELPAGLSLTADGTFTGSTQSSGVFPLLLQVCDDAEPTGCAEYNWELTVYHFTTPAQNPEAPQGTVADVDLSEVDQSTPTSETTVSDELPFTGFDSLLLGWAGIVSLVLGAGAVSATKAAERHHARRGLRA